jgi:hypothetical protein
MALPRIIVFYFFVCASVLYSCSNETASDHMAADSVTVVADSTADMYAVSVPSSERYIDPEDTMKALKVVYVIEKEGATAYTKMEGDAAMASVLSHGQKLEVLEEYPEWYKVRFRNNSEIYIFYVLKKVTSPENPVGITLFYPEFKISIRGFIHEQEDADVARFYQQNGEEATKAQVIQKDTISLSEGLKSYGTVKHMEFFSKNKNDKFIVSLAYGQSLYEVIDEKNRPIGQSYNYLQWHELTPYKILPDSGGVFIPMSFGNLSKAEADLYRNTMAKKHQMKDTSMTITWEYDTYVDYVRKNRYFCYDLGDYYFRVQRPSEGNVVETRYIFIFQIESGC